MVWVKLPDDLMDRPEVVEIGTLAWALHVAALCYSNRQLTDGLVPSGQVRRLTDLDDVERLVGRLVAAGWWTETDGGYQLVYLLDLQPTAADVTQKREATARRVASYRARSNGVTHAVSTALPVNPVPVPVPVPVPEPGPAAAVILPSSAPHAESRTAAAVRQADVSPSAPRRKPATSTQIKLAEIVDRVRAAGCEIHPTSRDGAALKSCAAPPALIAEAYCAAFGRRWDPVGDGFLRGNLSLHLVIDRLAGYEAELRPTMADYRETRYGRLALDGAGL